METATKTAKPVIQQLHKSIKGALSSNAKIVVFHKDDLTEEGYQDALQISKDLENALDNLRQLFRHEGMILK